jgi:hypothetical protein
MSFDTERLYNLLPAIYRIRDAEQGEPLKAFLAAIAPEIALLEEDFAQLYDDQFIETCAEWVVPYIGDLVGDRTLYNITPKLRTPRAEVANTIAYRRRKGTAAILEQLARDVTDFPAHVVEFFQILATTQYLNHLRPDNKSWVDLRQWEPLEFLNTPFDSLAHTVDVRRIANQRGRYNIPNIGIFLWRLKAYSLTNSPAVKISDRRYLFHPLGINTQLFNHPQSEEEFSHLSEPINLPMPISRRVLKEYLTDYYGKDKSIFMQVDNQAVALDRIIVCNLSDLSNGDWAHKPPAKIAIDPVLGRIAFPEAESPPQSVTVIYHYGFSTDLGGGEYDRTNSFDYELNPIVKVPLPQTKIQDALNAVTDGGVVEIEDSDLYQENLTINLNSGKLELRAQDGSRPTLVLTNELLITGKNETEVTIDGLVITGGSLKIPATNNQLKRLRLIHCTLVPGLSLKIDGTPNHPNLPSLIVESPDLTIKIDRCILGSLQIVNGAKVQIENSIIDAIVPENSAYIGLNNTPGGELKITNSTVIGTVNTFSIPLASNTIFMGLVNTKKRQAGCIRFCYLPLASQVPRRYYCQPTNEPDANRVRPQFNSLRYGDRDYCQLNQNCATEISQGADDESEMGAFHDLYQPQRATNLRVRLDEYLRFGLEAGIFQVT